MIFPMMFSGREPIGQQQWTAAGTYSFVVPPGVFYVHCVVIASGGGGARGAAGDTNESPAGGGGALSYRNGIAVTPGETITVVVPLGGSAGSSMSSGSAAADAGIKRGATWLVMAKGGAGGNWASGIGGAGGAAALGVGDVRWSGGQGQDATNFTYGGWSGRYTEAGQYGGSTYVNQSATLDGQNTGTSLGRGGNGGRSSASPGAVGGIRIMWGAGRAFPGNAADV